MSLYSKIFLSLLFVCIAQNVTAAPENIDTSYGVKDSDYRYLGMLGIGGATSLTGIALMIKSLWKTTSAEEFQNTRFIDRVREDLGRSGQFCSGLMVTLLGMGIIAGSKSIPNHFDALDRQHFRGY